MGAEKGGLKAPPAWWMVYISVNGEDLVNTAGEGSEPPTTVLAITSTGCSVTMNNTIVATWTYPGHCFLGFSTTQGATAPDATMEVGDTLTYTTNVSLALYSVGIPVPYLTTDGELTSVANAIRVKGGTSAELEYPSEFISAIQAIETGTPKAAQTYYPSTSDQTIASGYRLTGTQTFKGVLLTNLTADNIKKDVVVKVGDSADDDRIISVTGTYDGGGGGGTTAVTFSMLGSGSDYSITYVDADGNTVNTAYWILDSETVNATLGTPIATRCISPFGVETVPTPTNTSTFSSYTGSAGSGPMPVYYAFQVFIVG